MLFQELWSDFDFDPEHELLTLRLRLHFFGRELRPGGDKTDRGGNDDIRQGIEQDSGIRADVYFSLKPPPLVEDPERFYRSGVK